MVPGLASDAGLPKASGTSKVQSEGGPEILSLKKQFEAMDLRLDSEEGAVVRAAEGNGSTGGSSGCSKDAEIAQLKQMLSWQRHESSMQNFQSSNPG